MLKILVVDDDDIIRESVCSALAGAGHRVTGAPDGEKALSLLGASSFDLAVCDVHLPGIDGISLFRRLRRDAPGTDVVLMTAFGSVSDAVATMGDGAEYVTKPFDPDDLVRDVIEPIARRRAVGRAMDEARAFMAARQARSSLVGSSTVMRRLAERMNTVARTDAGVLVVGERGTGKDLVAGALHAQSARRDGPLVSLACAALLTPDTPGSRADGFRMAEGGTLVLRGVETLGKSAQAALLRTLESHQPRARSIRATSPPGVRLCALSREDLAPRVAAGQFLSPLYFRLAQMEIRVPPLRERAGDVYVLVTHLLRQLSTPDRPTPDLTPGAWRALHDYPFPGNVRELAWALERAVAASGGRTIGLEHLPPPVGDADSRKA